MCYPRVPPPWQASRPVTGDQAAEVFATGTETLGTRAALLARTEALGVGRHDWVKAADGAVPLRG